MEKQQNPEKNTQIIFMVVYNHGSQTVRRDALVRRFDFPRASHKSKIQYSLIQ